MGSVRDLDFLADVTARLGWRKAEAIVRQRLRWFVSVKTGGRPGAAVAHADPHAPEIRGICRRSSLARRNVMPPGDGTDQPEQVRLGRALVGFAENGQLAPSHH
jgi:hypothetical protein